MKKKHLTVKILSIILAAAILVVSVPFAATAEESTIRVGVVSDIHYFGNALKGGNCQAYKDFMLNTARSFDEEDALLDNALDAIFARALENGETYLLVPGDLTKDGEYLSHTELAARLEAYEQETGIDVLVVPGNHDINNTNGISFETGVRTKARPISPEEFRQIYANLGYDLADSFFVPEQGNMGGMLSYAATIGSYRVIAMDSCEYSPDNGADGYEHLTDGRIGEDLLQWIEDECAKAERDGLTIIGLQHHNTVPHIEIEESTFWAFVNEDWRVTADRLADAGMHYVFTGHLHSSDIASYTSDNGETITDILSSTITGYPNTFRLADFTSTGNDSITMDLNTYDIDVDRPVQVGDRVFEVPYKYTYSLGQTFGHGGMKNFLLKMLNGFIAGDMFQAIRNDGLYAYLAAELDLENLIIDALGTNGLAIGSLEILTVSQNVMSFIKDLCNQVDELYIKNPDDLLALANWACDTLLGYQVSDYPATAFSEYGFGSGSEPGTLDNLAQEILLYYYGGDEDISDNLFLNDVFDSFENGDGAKELFAFLRKTLINELAEDRILAKLDLNVDALFPSGTLLSVLGKVLDAVVNLIFKGNTDYLSVANGVLSLLGYGSIDGILDALVIDEYLTDSQFEAWGHTISWMLSSLCTDSNPTEQFDSDVVITYSGPVEVEATQDNYRLPSNIAVTLGEDAATSRNINWYTKGGVEGTDIELITYSETPVFTGTPTVGAGIAASEETVKRGYPGADLGTFAFLPCSISFVYHHIELTGLRPGTKYLYRVGDADKGWWSDVGIIETADNSDKFSFIHLSDPQAQNAKQYEAFAGVLDTALRTCPDAKLIVSSGDQTDYGTNFNHWKYLLNSSKLLLNVPFMPTTGNHEDEGSVLPNTFNLPNVPEQDEETGTYYSYDYNNAHFMVLNTNDTAEDKLGAAQLEWLKADAAASNAKWKFVVLHKAPYSNGSHYDDKDVIGIRSQLCTLMPLLGVDAVLQGHDHVYLRTDVLNANMVIPTATETATYNGLEYTMKVNPKGTIYSIPGTSGVKIYAVKDSSATDKLFPRAEALADGDHPIFTTFTIDGNCLYYDAYKVVDGRAERIDSYAIRKDDGFTGESGKLTQRIFSLLDFTKIWRFFAPIVTVIGRVMLAFSK